MQNPVAPSDIPVSETLSTTTSQTFSLISRLIIAIIVVIICIIISKLIARFAKKKILQRSNLQSQDQGEKVANLIGDIAFYTLLIFSVFIGFQILGMDVGLILGGVSFGVGLAFKEVLGNMIAGIMILSTKQLTIGDVIEIQGSDTIFGRIEEITIRYTVVRTLDMRQVVLPNMTLIKTPIKTFSAEEIVRLTDSVQVDYETNLQHAQEVIIGAIQQIDHIQAKENTRTAVQSFDDSGITIKYYYYFDPKSGILADYVKGLVNHAIDRAFKKENISIPFPHRTLVTKEQSHPVDIGCINIATNHSSTISQQ